MEEIDGPTTVIFLPSSVANSEKKRERRTLLDLLIDGGGGGRGGLEGWWRVAGRRQAVEGSATEVLQEMNRWWGRDGL